MLQIEQVTSICSDRNVHSRNGSAFGVACGQTPEACAQCPPPALVLVRAAQNECSVRVPLLIQCNTSKRVRNNGG